MYICFGYLLIGAVLTHSFPQRSSKLKQDGTVVMPVYGSSGELIGVGLVDGAALTSAENQTAQSSVGSSSTFPEHVSPDYLRRMIRNASNSRMGSLKIVTPQRNDVRLFPKRDSDRPVVSDRRTNQPDDSRFVFPDETGNIPQTQPQFLAPPATSPGCNSGDTFCESVDGYPSDYVRLLAQRNAFKYRGLFGTDVLPDVNITHRIDLTNERQACNSVPQTAYPQTAKNKDGDWAFIINDAPKYVQGLRVEKCSRPEVPCEFDGIQLGYRTECRQKFAYRQLVALDKDGNDYIDSFSFPSCCTCYIISSGPMARFRADKSMSMTPAIKKRKSNK